MTSKEILASYPSKFHGGDVPAPQCDRRTYRDTLTISLGNLLARRSFNEKAAEDVSEAVYAAFQLGVLAGRGE